jgi:hypothetical protein
MTPAQLQETTSLLALIQKKQEDGADCDEVDSEILRLVQLGAAKANPDSYDASATWVDPEDCEINVALPLQLQAQLHSVFGVWGLRSMTDSHLWLAMKSLTQAASMLQASDPLRAVALIARFIRASNFASATTFTHLFEDFGANLIDWGSEIALKHPQAVEAEEFHLSLTEVLLPASLQQFDEESAKYEGHAIDLVACHLSVLLNTPPKRQQAAPWASVARIMELADHEVWGVVAMQLLEVLEAGDPLEGLEVALKKAAALEDGSSFIVGEARVEERKAASMRRYETSLEDLVIGRLFDSEKWDEALSPLLSRARRIEREGAEGKREMLRLTTSFDAAQCDNWSGLAVCYSELKRDADFRTLLANILKTLRTADAGDILGMPDMGSSVKALVNTFGALATQHDLSDCLDAINAFTDDYPELGWDDDA